MRLQFSDFRNLRRGSAEFPPGITIVVGENGAGKTNLLEAAQYACCGRSFRTSHEQDMVREGSEFFRVQAEVEYNLTTLSRAAVFEPGEGARVNSGGGPQWLAPGSVLCFSPDDLQLIKGPPSKRRRFLDEAIVRRIPTTRRTLLEYQKVLAQRNSFLRRARAGIVLLDDISPWDRQLAALAVRIYEARREHCRLLEPYFEAAYREIAGEDVSTGIGYVSQLAGLGAEEAMEEGLVRVLAERWHEDLERLSTGTGTHRDDIDLRLNGMSLKPYGSQGEQRTAVLALLLADRRLGGSSGEPPLLLLDDVMSELDPDRRRRLMSALAREDFEGFAPDSLSASPGTPESPEINGWRAGATAAAQTIITASDAELFSEEELEAAFVIEVENGSMTVTGAMREA